MFSSLDEFKKGSFMVMRTSNYLDDPIYHLKVIDSSLRIIEGIFWEFSIPCVYDGYDAFEVFVDTYKQYIDVYNYLESDECNMFYIYYSYDEDKYQDGLFTTHKLDYSKAKERKTMYEQK